MREAEFSSPCRFGLGEPGCNCSSCFPVLEVRLLVLQEVVVPAVGLGGER